MIDGAGNQIKEMNYTDELKELWDNILDAIEDDPQGWKQEIFVVPPNMGGKVVVDSCDGGFVLVHPGSSGASITCRTHNLACFVL